MLVGYARVSTSGQKTDPQLQALKKAGCEKLFQETASGAQRDRPELKKAIEFVRDGDVLITWKLDRLARSLKQLIETVELLETKNVGFRSLTESIDTTSASGKLTFHIFSALAEFERAMIRERTMLGLENANRLGRRGGRPRMSEDALSEAKALLLSPDLTFAEVARRVKVSPATLYRYLPGGRHSL